MSKFNENDYKYVHPETMKETSFNSLPKVYKESILKSTPAHQFKESELEEKKPSEPQYKDAEERKRMTTTDGKRLSVFLREAKQGGCVDNKGKLIFEKDERYDPNKSWKYPYGKQLVEIRKKDSHKLGKKEWKLVYTEDYKVVHGAVKFEVIRKLADNLEEAQRRWSNDMLAKDTTKRLCAIMCAMSNESPFRSGNTYSATRKKNKTFGITTLKVKHVSIIDGVDGEKWLKVSFKGKGGEPIKKIIKNPSVVNSIKSLIKGKEPDDYIFTNNGKLVDAAVLNQYCRSIGIPKYHHFRHIRASQAFKEAVDKIIEGGYIPDMPTSKELHKIINLAAGESARLLGNQAATCIENYIAPQLMFDVFKRYDLPVPDVIKNLSKLPSTVSKKEMEELEQKKFWSKLGRNADNEDIEDEEDEVDSSVDDIECQVFAELENIPNPILDFEATTYQQDEDARQDFETYLLTYQHDDNDIINNPDDVVTATFLVPVGWKPDFSDATQLITERGDNYLVNKDTSYDCRQNSDVDKWGYNDYIGVTPEEMNKKIMEKCRKDLERISKEVEENDSRLQN